MTMNQGVRFVSYNRMEEYARAPTTRPQDEEPRGTGGEAGGGGGLGQQETMVMGKNRIIRAVSFSDVEIPLYGALRL
jgi:hypothetical protein